MRIAVDIMSGDAPAEELLKGALKAHEDFKVEIVLVGAEEIVAPYEDTGNGIYTAFSKSVVEMTDDALAAVKEKADSSMAIGAKLLKNGEADAFVSPGNTGALLGAATLTVRKIKGIRRPAIASIIPLEKPFILLDSGANTELLPENMLQFAYMGAFYAEKVFGIESPKVALLNNGTEETKGTELYRESYKLIKISGLNFVGNCEGRDIPFGFCDVLVCEGFAGNVALKLIEGMGKFMSNQINGLFRKNIKTKLAYLLTRKGIKNMRKKLDHKEYGGAPILGIAKPVIKAHGSSDARGFYNAIKQAKIYAESDIIGRIETSIAKIKEQSKDVRGDLNATSVSEAD